MSTLSGQTSKGEKTKPKFQSLDINSLYRVSRGENLEKQQQKSSSIYIKHGMQSLGKVPNARRAPANLPSLKAEHSGTDAAVPLVPPGAPGWGKQDPSTTGVAAQQQQQQPSQQTQQQQQQPSVAPNVQMPNANSAVASQNVAQQPSPQQLSSHQAAIALPVTTTIPPHNKQLIPSAQPVPTDKLWSSVMSGQDAPHPPLYQSPQFQHEFPSLSSGDGGPTRTGSDAPYPSGLSLRPQTEGSWTQGGQRPGSDPVGPPRPGSVPPGAPPQLSAQASLPPPQQQPFPPQIRGVMPSFMYKGSNFQQGSGIGIQNQNTPSPVNGRGGATRPVDNRPPRLADRDREVEDIVPRPIIKDEELSRMAEISKDMGWADSDEIDYNQKLAFSDDESDRPMPKKEIKKIQQQTRDNKEEERNDNQQRQWSGSRSSRGRSSEEEDVWSQRRSHAEKEMEIVVQRAKQRKEEEEKRFNQERKQGAAKKLMELEEKIQKRDRDNQEGAGTINPSNVPPKPINHVDIPLPEFQKEKERDRDMPRDRDNRSRTPNESIDMKNQSGSQGNSFKHLTQIEGKNFLRKHQKQSESRDRDRNVRENNASFSKQFQNDLPPRFLKHQRNNSNSNLQGQQQYHQFDNNRWMPGQGPSKPQQPPHSRNLRQDSPDMERDLEDERRDYLRQSSDESYRSTHHLQQETSQKSQENRYDDLQDNRHQAYDQQFGRRDREEDKWQKEKEDIRHSSYDQQYGHRDREENKWQKDKEDRWHKDKDKKQEDHPMRQSSDDWSDKRDKGRDEKPLDRYDRLERDRPQRPDSRDSRSTRHSRDSEPRDYMGSWAETAYEPPYEEKSRDHVREDRRAVPGPITKDRIEADDMRSEKRNLTQLKRGQPVVVKSEMKKEEKEEPDTKKETQIIGTWADSIPPALEEAHNKFEDEKKATDSHKLETRQFGEPPKKLDKTDDYKDRNRGRQHPGNKGWGSSSNDYHSRASSWQKRPPSRGHKSGRFGHEYHGTDSDGSMEDHSAEKNDLRDQKGDQKLDSRDQRSPKPSKKLDKDDKNRDNKQDKSVGEQRKQDKPERKDNYVPRGEPSRHGRGGGNFRSGRMGGLGKRIDGYGPPPSKSPFGHHEDKEKKNSEENPLDNMMSLEDKTKQNQQALAAGITGKSRIDTIQNLDDKNKARGKLDPRKNKPRGKDDVCDTNSENSDEKDKKDGRKLQDRKMQGSRPQISNRGRNNPPRMGGEKRNYDAPRGELSSRQNSNNSLKKEDKLTDQNILANAFADITMKNREDNEPADDKDEKGSLNGDSEGFQEVKSKKTVKERQKSIEDKQQLKSLPKNEPNKDALKGDRDRDRKPKNSAALLTQQQIQNIPSLMATPVNPPPVLPQPKSQFDRSRQSKLAPRFAKQKLQKAQMQQQVHGLCDVNDLNKVNQSMNVYGMKDTVSVPPPVATCAWDKPLGPQLRNMEHDGMLGVTIDGVKGLDQTQQSSQGTSPNNEKMLGKPGLQDKALLDGSTPPVNTIIFENTNFKSAPGARNPRTDKPRSKLEEGAIENSVKASFNIPSVNELLQSKNDGKADPIQLPLFKEDSADMKLDFFGSDLQFTDDKGAKTLMSKSIHAITSCNNTVDSLDIKIASVKKVWETSEQEGEENQISFGGPPLDSNVFNQGKDTPDDNHEGYSPSPNQTASTTTNVCKVKPTQQVSGSGQTILSSTSHQQHSGIVAPGLMGNPLSPPPMPPVLGASVGLGPQQFTANQHIGYQASLSGSTQFGMSAIPSPPTVPLVYNSTQQLQAAQTAGLYGAFQIDQTGVLGGQGRSQFSQYPNYHGLGQTAASSPYSAQSVYLQTAPPHPPAAQAPPEMYPNMNNYRLSATAPFGQSQQLNNPTTVLISSTSNSLMSASVKPSSQPISAIGTKAGGVGQAYQQQSQQGQQVYMAYDPSIQAANYLPPSAGVMQRGPAGPVQNNVVPGLQPSSSYYSGSTGGQTGYFQQPGSSTMPSAQLQQHQASFGLQGNVFGTHSQSHTNTGLQNYSPFLPTSLQMAAALNAQQFRSGLPAPYMKGVGSQQIGDQSGRPQQLKSPSSQEVLSSVFNSVPQIPSPKSRQNCKHPPPQSSPTAQHKYNLYQGVGGQQNPNIQRYPAPIQRPMNFQQMQQSNSANQKHRNNANNKAPNRQYYGGQSNSLSSQSEKSDDSKMTDAVTLNANPSTNPSKSAIGTSSTVVAVNASSEKVKDNIKEETAALKD